jgi:hypothetical protein
MYRTTRIILVFAAFSMAACSTGYKARPVPFKAPASYPNARVVAGVTVGAEAYVEPERARESFGFDIRSAGMLPVQVVFDNQGTQVMEINAAQTFLEDREGNLWPILAREVAYQRATRYAETKEIFKEGAYHGMLGAAAGAVIGAAVGVVTGENVVSAAGKGAAVGAGAGATLGGLKGYGSDRARREVISDLQRKSLEARPVVPGDLAYGFLFFPGEARSAGLLRLQLLEVDSGAVHVVKLFFPEEGPR